MTNLTESEMFLSCFVSTFLFFIIVIFQQELELEVGLAFNHVTMEEMESIGF